MNLTLLIVILYGLICFYSSFISFHAIVKGREHLSQGHLRKLVDVIILTFVIAFVYAFWQIFRTMGILPLEANVILIIDNVLLIAFLTVLTYLSLVVKNVSTTFGFSTK